jgi:two-component system, OmpR family, KDP operon response regulator KdpE
MSTPVRILIVDDEPQIQRFLRASLVAEGYRTIEARTAVAALAAARARKPDLVLLDLELPDADSADVIRSLREWSQKVRSTLASVPTSASTWRS